METKQKTLWRKWSRLIDANRFDEAVAVETELDTIFETANPGARARREAWQAERVEDDARARCGAFSEGDESAVIHDPRD